jgi:hypothetical protein
VYFSRILHINNLKIPFFARSSIKLEDKVQYVLNPDGDLVQSQSRLEEYLHSRPRWVGVKGREPESEELIARLKDGYSYV